jgi:hypothetical protein
MTRAASLAKRRAWEPDQASLGAGPSEPGDTAKRRRRATTLIDALTRL